MQRAHRTPWHAHPPRLCAGPLCAGLLAVSLLAACAERAPPPAFGPTSAEPVTVIVQRGDTLLAIARRHHVGLQPLASANGLPPPYRIRPGQVLHVPGAVQALPPPVAVASSGSALGTPGPVTASPASAGAMRGPEAAASAPSIPATPTGRTVTAEALPPPPFSPPPFSPPPSSPPLSTPPLSTPPVQQAAATPAQSAEPDRAPERPATRTAEPAAESAPLRPAAEPAARRLPPGRFAWPVRGQVVSGFGSKGGGMVNDGMNIAAPRGTPVRAAADGVILYAGNEVRGFGNLVLVRHDNGWVTAYGHTDRVLVKQGQRVRLGEEIARVGSTGAVASPQLHFQVRRDGKPVDPAAHLERAVAGR